MTDQQVAFLKLPEEVRVMTTAFLLFV